jgi:hypothetical protein
MPLTLAQYRTRIGARLLDASNAVYSTTTLDEALKTALDDYSAALPATSETVITLPGAGREIALSGVSGLIQVLDVWWPYDSDADDANAWPPNQAAGFRVWWDDGSPVLFLAAKASRSTPASAGAGPQTGDELRLWYTKVHTIQDLDSAAATTVFAHHESQLVTGAAGYAAASEHMDQVGTVRLDPRESQDLASWAALRLKEFRDWLDTLRTGPGPAGSANPFGPGWPMDKWETR